MISPRLSAVAALVLVVALNSLLPVAGASPIVRGLGGRVAAHEVATTAGASSVSNFRSAGSATATARWAGQSCARFAPITELSAELERPVRFDHGGGSVSRGWQCWYDTGQVSFPDLLVDAYDNLAQGEDHMRGATDFRRVTVSGIGGKVSFLDQQYETQLFVLKANGFFYVDSEVENNQYQLLLTLGQLETVARGINQHLSSDH